MSVEILLFINPAPRKQLGEIESLHWTGTQKNGLWFAHGVHVAPTIAGKFRPVDYDLHVPRQLDKESVCWGQHFLLVIEGYCFENDVEFC
jgi:hypothetical protein